MKSLKFQLIFNENLTHLQLPNLRMHIFWYVSLRHVEPECLSVATKTNGWMIFFRAITVNNDFDMSLRVSSCYSHKIAWNYHMASGIAPVHIQNWCMKTHQARFDISGAKHSSFSFQNLLSQPIFILGSIIPLIIRRREYVFFEKKTSLRVWEFVGIPVEKTSLCWLGMLEA